MNLFDADGRVLVSPSRLKTWLDCPLKWKAVYVDEVKSPATPSLVFGTAIHKALEAHHRSRWLGGTVTAEELEQSFAEAVKAGCAEGALDPAELDEGEFRAQARRLIDLYLARFGEEKVAAAELSLTAPIVDFTGEDLGAQLVGVIDLVTEDRRVVDLKSSARSSDLFDLTIAHSLQLDAYRWLMLHSTGAEPKGMEIRMLVRRKNPEVQAFEVPAREGFEAFLRTVRCYVDFVRQSGHASPRPGLFCGESCPAYRACRAYHGMEAA